MNERIKLLAIKCGAEESKDFGVVVPRDDNFDIPKFAELIISECITLIPYGCQVKDGRLLSRALIEHFFIEK